MILIKLFEFDTFNPNNCVVSRCETTDGEIRRRNDKENESRDRDELHNFSSVRAAWIIIRVTLLLNQPLKMNSLPRNRRRLEYQRQPSFPRDTNEFKEMPRNSQCKCHNSSFPPATHCLIFFSMCGAHRETLGNIMEGFSDEKQWILRQIWMSRHRSQGVHTADHPEAERCCIVSLS